MSWSWIDQSDRDKEWQETIEAMQNVLCLAFGVPQHGPSPIRGAFGLWWAEKQIKEWNRGRENDRNGVAG